MSLATAGLCRSRTRDPTCFADLYQWIRSDLGSPSNSGANDQSGRGNNITQPTVGLQPTYNASGGKNNRPYWAFRGASVFENTWNVASGLASPHVPLTIACVFRFNVVPAAAGFAAIYSLKGTATGGSTSFNDLLPNALGGIYLPWSFNGNGQGGSSPASVGFNVALNTTIHALVTAHADFLNDATPSHYTASLDGTVETVAASGNTGRTATDLGSIGARLSSTDTLGLGPANMDFYELIVWKRQFQANEMADLYTNYLAPLYT